MMSTWATIFTFLMLASGTHSVNPRMQRINDPVGHTTGYTQVLEEHITTPAAGASDPFSLITYPSSLTTVYAYGQDLISQDRKTGPTTWSLSYYCYDGGGHVRALANEVGTLTDTYTFDAFGVLIAKTGSTQNNYLYRGEQFDPDLHLYYQRARYLNTDTGRFWTQDTYEGSPGTPASLHKYFYANNDPVGGWDPSGNVSLLELETVISIIQEHTTELVIGGGAIAATSGFFLAKSILRPFFRFVGELRLERARPFERLSRWERFMRFFRTPTTGYPPVGQTWLGRLLQGVAGKLGTSLDQGHLFIQQHWFSGANRWYPDDPVATRGMRRLANAGFNLGALPTGLNRYAGQRNWKGRAVTGVVGVGAVAATVVSLTHVVKMVHEISEYVNGDEDTTLGELE
jgi:RHS repeat-associated protein